VKNETSFRKKNVGNETLFSKSEHLENETLLRISKYVENETLSSKSEQCGK
jgi:hypothetical protein